MNGYMNLFSLIGKTDAEAKARAEAIFETIFFDEEERFYFEMPGREKGYMLDTGNLDARTEGMSYGMMMAVQMNRQDLFDKLWLFSCEHMLQKDGVYEGYFAWSVNPDGSKRYEGPAPDGEEYFAMALIFASNLWDDRQAPFDYMNRARTILRHAVHQHEMVKGGQPMWDSENHLIKFVPETPFSDPSYHLPHFYDIFSFYADECDCDFWKEAASASRKYISLCADPVTGMCPEYAEFSGEPRHMFGKEMDFYSDAYRVSMNIALDSIWNGKNASLSKICENLQRFFYENTVFGEYGSYMKNGEKTDVPAMHPVAITATLAAASAASDGEYKKIWLERFWNTPLRKGNRRYYDNCLYFFSFLMLAGFYRTFESR